MKSSVPTTLLLVDDRDENLLVLETLLKGPEVRLLKATSGRTALELLLQHEVALALIDVQMPEMDGFELAELMRGSSRTARVPIIFITAAIHERTREFRGYDAGAVDFLFKPVQPRVLRNKVQVFVDLYEQRKELESTLRLNEELVAIVSHDLRNPLSSIGTAGQLLQAAESDSYRTIGKRISRSVVRMTSIINDLLDLSRARLSGGIPIERGECDMARLAAAAIDELVNADGPTQQVKLESRGETGGFWDAPRMEQVISNLVGNALQHGSRGGPVAVMIDGTESEQVKLFVDNDGTIPEEQLPTLFDPFGGGDKTRQRGGGLGLGLYIVDQIVRAHCGSVWATSTLSEGTRINLVLPRGL